MNEFSLIEQTFDGEQELDLRHELHVHHRDLPRTSIMSNGESGISGKTEALGLGRGLQVQPGLAS